MEAIASLAPDGMPPSAPLTGSQSAPGSGRTSSTGTTTGTLATEPSLPAPAAAWSASYLFDTKYELNNSGSGGSNPVSAKPNVTALENGTNSHVKR